MPRPFPFAINVGTDICSIKRIFKLLLARRDPTPFLRKILNEQERKELPYNKIEKPLSLYFEALDKKKELLSLWTTQKDHKGEVHLVHKKANVAWMKAGGNILQAVIANGDKAQESYIGEKTKKKLKDRRKQEVPTVGASAEEGFEDEAFTGGEPSSSIEEGNEETASAAKHAVLRTGGIFDETNAAIRSEQVDSKEEVRTESTPGTADTAATEYITPGAENFIENAQQESFMEEGAAEVPPATTTAQTMEELAINAEVVTKTKVKEDSLDGVDVEVSSLTGVVAQKEEGHMTMSIAGDRKQENVSTDLDSVEGAFTAGSEFSDEVNEVTRGFSKELQQQSKPVGEEQEKIEANRLLAELNREITVTYASIKRSSTWLAGRYAAKEAAKKAHRSRNLTWHDIWIKSSLIVSDRSKAPEAHIISEDGSWENAQIVPMNISHDTDYATAICLSHETSSALLPDVPRLPNVPRKINKKVRIVGTGPSTTSKTPELDIIRHLNIQKLSAERELKVLKQNNLQKQEEQEKIFQKLFELEEKVLQADEERNFVQRTYTSPEKTPPKRVARTIFVGNLSPETTIQDLEDIFHVYCSTAKAYLYANEEGTLLGTGAIVMKTVDEAAKARQEKDKSELHGNIIRCLPWFRQSLRRFQQRGVMTDSVFLKQRQNLEDRERALLESPTFQEQLQGAQDDIPRPLLEPEPLPQPSSPQYILVRELFRIQEEYHQRRARGIFVKNLNPDVTEDDLLGIFNWFSKEVSVKIRRRKDGTNMGSAFVTFETEEEAVQAREKIDGTLLLGAAIQCQELGTDKESLGKWMKTVGQGLAKHVKKD